MVAAQEGLSRTEHTDPEGGILSVLALLAAVGPAPRPGAAILDLGCGAGRGVTALLARGFDAFGVDLFEYWGEHAEWYWTSTTCPSPVERLSVAEAEPYRLPYPDAIFDHVVSAQVLEHVDDRAAVFAEIRRVLKPGGISANIFPSRWSPIIEGHTGIPIPLLCKSDSYLKLAALAGFRSGRSKGMRRRDAYRSSAAQMATTHYPSGRRLLGEARGQGLEARFATRDYVAKAGTGWSRLHDRLAPFGLTSVVRLAGRLLLNHMLILRRP